MTTADQIIDTEPTVLLERVGNVAVITLNRPHVMNAINAEMSAAAEAAINELLEDPDLRVGVLTGAGRAFTAGADLKEVAAGRSLLAPGQRETGFGGFTRRLIPKPLIAAVNGYALGGGTELMLACDLAIMSEDATLGLPEVRRGLIAAEGGLLRLARQVPQKLALEVLLTGSPVDAPTASQWGLVNRVVPTGEVLATALELAERIAANAPLSIAATKRLVYAGPDLGSDWGQRAWEASNTETRAILKSEDAREGPRAFAEKRPAQWAGR